MNDPLFKKEGYDLIGAAFEVHNEQGGGVYEEIYQESLEVELSERGIPFETKPQIPVFYKGRELVKKYIPDLVLHAALVVELKSVSALAPEHEAQLLNYLRISRRKVGYLINFGPIDKLEYRRYVL